MNMLNRPQIEERLRKRELLRNPRRKVGGHFDVEKDSYDLAAGTAIWKTPARDPSGGDVKTLRYVQRPSKDPQPTVTVQPGQMIFVVTLEDIVMPRNLCGTVYSRNQLALAGILALNAGHVDSGYEGPIVIRLINLRAIPWTLTLGDPIFTITFQTVDEDPNADPKDDRHISQEDMILRVRETANAALSNALYDLYSVNVDQRLNEFRTVDVNQRLHEFRTAALTQFEDIRDRRWVRKDKIWSVLFDDWWKKALAIASTIILIAGALGGAAAGISVVVDALK